MNRSPRVLKGGKRKRDRNKAARRWKLKQLINKEGGRCPRCGESVNLTDNGLLCASCNEAKGSSPPEEVEW